jgi:membrane fusion protein (multidrug efflux system)
VSEPSAEAHSASEPKAVSQRVPRRRKYARSVALVLSLAAMAAAGAAYVAALGTESTDDAQVEGHVQLVSPRVSGVIARTLVVDNQKVKAGDVLVELDRVDFEARLTAAKADALTSEAAVGAARAQLALTEKMADALLSQASGGLKQAASSVSSSRALVAQSQADLTAARARQKLAESDFARARRLSDGGILATSEFEAAQAAFDQANAGASQAEARLASAEASISSSFGGVESARGRLVAAQTAPEQVENARAAVRVAEARLEQSRAAARLVELNLSYTTIRAPSAGIVARRAAELGQTVSPERPLMAIVPLDDVWVVANFKEDQLAKLRPGARAQIEIDSYEDRAFTGHVESLSAGTGSRFALLPPDNASGNFVKVVQRVPVLIRLDHKNNDELRPGMSAKVTVRLR